MPLDEVASAPEPAAPAAPESSAPASDSVAAAAPASAGPDYAKLYEESSSRLKQLEEYVPKLHSVFERIQSGEEARLKALGMIPDKQEPQYLTRQDFEKFARAQTEERAMERAQAAATREIEGFMSKAEAEHPEVFGDPDLRDLFYARISQNPRAPLSQIADSMVKAHEARSAKWAENYAAGKQAAPRVIKTGSAGGRPTPKKLDLSDPETRISAILSDIGAEA